MQTRAQICRTSARTTTKTINDYNNYCNKHNNTIYNYLMILFIKAKYFRIDNEKRSQNASDVYFMNSMKIVQIINLLSFSIIVVFVRKEKRLDDKRLSRQTPSTIKQLFRKIKLFMKIESTTFI